MAKLFAFGCSYTYGHGLSDCIVGKTNAGPEPSKLTYINVLAEKLGIEKVWNLAMPGKSNKWILSAIEENLSLIDKDDIVIVQWSFIDRSAILGNEFKKNYSKSIDLGPWKKDRINSYYYKFLYHEYDHKKQTIWYINYANFLLKNRGINKTLHTAPPQSLDIEKYIINKENFLNDCLPDHGIDYAQDNNHPGPKTHIRFANHLLEKYPWLKE